LLEVFGGRQLNDKQKLGESEIRAGSTLFQAYDFGKSTAVKETYSVRDRYGRSYSISMFTNKVCYH